MVVINVIGIDIYSWIILPLLIILARVIDVSMGTIRVIFISKGFKKVSTILGFFEVLVWLAAISQIMQNLTNIYYYFVYAFGFALGTYVGMVIEEKLSIGKCMLRIITRKDAAKLVTELKKHNYNLTVLDARGKHGEVKIIFMVIERHNMDSVLEIVKEINPHAFYTIEDVRFAIDKRKELTKRNVHRLKILKHK